uniref:hypothetical protein n=1 Tax=Altererythrobacter segetis TaxID=1104773 RepID=UPI00140B34FA|nr:hypothetical protein [Altererythrobacter segetis]
MSYARKSLENRCFYRQARKGLQSGLQPVPQTLADCHSDLPLVNTNAPDAAGLVWRPAHDIGDLLIGETCLERFGAKRAA